MSVRAKFRVRAVEHHDGDHFVVLMVPVTSGSEENEMFYRYTPSGQIELSTINELAAGNFKPGREYYVDFTEAE